MDESFPHLHIMCLPTIVDPVTGKILNMKDEFQNELETVFEKQEEEIEDWG